MAKAKKAPAKKASANNAGLPAGFTRVEGFAQTWNPEEQPELQGVWGKVRTIPVKRGKKVEDSRVVDIEQEDGVRLTVWESATLKRAFDEIDEGDEVYIRFDGYGTAKKGQNAPKLFTIAHR